jgi:hypothetical protein
MTGIAGVRLAAGEGVVRVIDQLLYAFVVEELGT